MKGFIKILESVLASTIIIAMMTFFAIPHAVSNWDYSLLQIRAQDSLASLYKSGSLDSFVFSNNVTGLNEKLDGMLPETSGYSAIISGIPNPVIYIVSDDKDTLDDELNNFSVIYKNRTIELRTEAVNWSNMEPKTNVIFLFNESEIYDNQAFLEDMIEDGKTVFLAFTPDFENSFIKKIFTQSADTDALSRIRKYCYNITGTPCSLMDILYPKEDVLMNGRSIYYENIGVMDEDNLKASLMWASGESYNMDIMEKKPPESGRYINVYYLVSGNNTESYKITLKTWFMFY
jgi:hypothetical protein